MPFIFYWRKNIAFFYPCANLRRLGDFGTAKVQKIGLPLHSVYNIRNVMNSESKKLMNTEPQKISHPFYDWMPRPLGMKHLPVRYMTTYIFVMLFFRNALAPVAGMSLYTN